MIKLYGNHLTRATRCLWMLEELGLPYENVAVDREDAGSVSAINPNAKLPCLTDGDFTLFESMAINLYLGQKYGRPPFWPDSAEAIGLIYQWTLWGMTEAEPPLVAMLVERVFKPQGMADETVIAAATEKLRPLLRVLEDSLAGKDWLLPGAFSAADLNLASVVYLVDLVGFDITAFPAVKAWLQRCTGRPVWRKAHGI